MANCFNDFVYSIGHEIGKQFDSSLPEVENLNQQVHSKFQKLQLSLLQMKLSNWQHQRPKVLMDCL